MRFRGPTPTSAAVTGEEEPLKPFQLTWEARRDAIHEYGGHRHNGSLLPGGGWTAAPEAAPGCACGLHLNDPSVYFEGRRTNAVWHWRALAACGQEEGRVYETEEDLAGLQTLLDRSYAAAGAHLRSIHTDGRRMTARQAADRLQGMCLLVLATVTADGRPLTGPVDGVFHRGSFHFGTDTGSMRWRHLQRNPAVSATHLPSEDWAVTVHGRAVPADTSAADTSGLRSALLEVYVPRYGPGWPEFLDSGPVYLRIEAERMFAVDVTAGSSEYSSPT